MIVAVALNPSIDKLAEVEHLEPGKIHRPITLVAVAGGKGVNAARVACALGADTTVACILGGHAGDWVAESLDAEGIPAVVTHCKGETRSSLSVYARDSGDLTEFYEPGPKVCPEEWKAFVDMVVVTLEGADWVTISGSLPGGIAAPEIGNLVQRAREGGARVGIDLRGEALREAMARRPDLVKVNHHEARDLLASSGGSKSPGTAVTLVELVRLAGSLAADAAAKPSSAGGGTGPVAVVTGGRVGAAMRVGSSTWTASVPGEGPYSVGSGDAFLGAMVAALDGGSSWVEALRQAAGAGAANAMAPGAGRLQPELVAELAASVVLVEEAG